MGKVQCSRIKNCDTDSTEGGDGILLMKIAILIGHFEFNYLIKISLIWREL